MRAQDYYSWDKEPLAKLKAPVRRVMEAYGNAEKWFADIKARLFADFAMPFLSDAIHRLEHAQPERVDRFDSITRDYLLPLPYPGTPELDEDLHNDLDRVFQLCVWIVDAVDGALNDFIAAAKDGPFNALSLKAEELQVENTDDRRKLLQAWAMWDNGGMSRASFDNWCARLFQTGGDD